MTTKWEVEINCKGPREVSDVKILISDEAIEKLFDETYEGYCPICRDNTISEGETICCSCLEQIMVYHKNTCGCIE